MSQLNLKLIKDRRLELGLTLENLAKDLGFKNASTYMKYESGEYGFRATMLPVLAKSLKCEIDDFFTKQ